MVPFWMELDIVHSILDIYVLKNVSRPPHLGWHKNQKAYILIELYFKQTNEKII